MFRTTVRSSIAGAWLVCGVVALGSALPVAPLSAQGATQGVSQTLGSPWEPWIGCWDQVPRESDVTNVGGRVCVVPTSSPMVVDLVSIVGDSITTRERIDATPGRREVREGECAGTDEVNAVGVRVYRRTTLRCGGQDRLVNSVMSMSSRGEWIDVRGVAFGTNVGVRPARYRETSPSEKLPAEVAQAMRGRSSGMQAIPAARIAATGRVTTADVVEASKYLEIGVLQTWLAERGQGFALDAKELVALEKAGVAPSVIDVMVALSYPEQFALDRTRIGDPPPDVLGARRGGVVYAGGDGYGYDPYGYDSYGYGYGRGYGWYGGLRPIVVVPRSSGNGDAEHGRVEKGRGYVSGKGSSSGGSSGASDRSRGSGASTSKGNSSGSGSKSTGRKAKEKP